MAFVMLFTACLPAGALTISSPPDEDPYYSIVFEDGVLHFRLNAEKVYDMLLSELFAEFPDLKIIIMGPYVLPGSASEDRPDQPDRFREFTSGVAEMACIARKLSEKYGCAFIDLQSVLDEAIRTVPVRELTGDGVHPTAKGHEIIKAQWLKAFSEITESEAE